MDPRSLGTSAGLKVLHDNLQRYSGWLGRERTSAMVRADVEALGAAIEARADASLLLQSLDINLARLPKGECRKMLLIVAGQMRTALGA